MHSLPFKLPQDGKIFYLLTDSEVESFNYYKDNGHTHGLSVSLKMAITDFGRVLIVQVKKITSFLSKASSKISKKPTKPTANRHTKQELPNRNISKMELARKQGIPELLIEKYIKNHHDSNAKSLNYGMYRDYRSSLIVQQENNQQSPSCTCDSPTLYSKILKVLRVLF